MKKILTVEHLQKYYGGKGSITKAVDNISFSVEEGEYIGIMGASGSGKTTILNCISTIDQVTSGNIYIEEQDVTAMKRMDLSRFRRDKLGFIFQDFNLLDTMTAYENIALTLTIQKKKPDEVRMRVAEVAKMLNIENVLNKYPYQLSGGQKQRVAAARALIGNPSIILADEPTGSLDSRAARVMLECFKKMNETMNATILMVTHDPFSASYCQRILFIKDGKLFNELMKGKNDRKEFFNRIMEVNALLGGDLNVD
ncbi:MAG: ABC transporter ATP-binding protein [Lachnospiraceae bacterium]|nr:ABC transporter ATP-binding protein [Lachnospiraceae bacterium]